MNTLFSRALVMFLVPLAMVACRAEAQTPQSPPTTVAAAPMKAAAAEPEAPAEKPLVQIALLLDTSSSMSGLINQARTQLWKVVNDLAVAERKGQSPRLEVSLYEYGKSTLTTESGFVRQILALTDDLDAVSEALFALETNGGDEYCGHVIKSALDQLAWDDSSETLKMIFIAGNEPFSQGPTDYRTTVKDAVTRGITVNTIHCGDEATGAATGWKDGAVLADGAFLAIDHNTVVAHIDAPQDEEIAKLGAALNDTYLAYGAHGAARAARQSAQDMNAAADMGSATNRALSKASGLYRNGSWDLVDAINDAEIDLADIPEDQLPEAMRGMNGEERKAHVAGMNTQRLEITAKIQTLNDARNTFIAQKRAEDTGDASLDQAMIDAIRTQAKGKHYNW